MARKKNVWIKVSIALTASLLARIYEKMTGTPLALEDGGVGGTEEGEDGFDTGQFWRWQGGRGDRAMGAWIWKIVAGIMNVQNYGEKYGRV